MAETIPETIIPNTAVEYTSKMKNVLESIKAQYCASYESLIGGVPAALVVIPMTLFFLSPSASRGIFLFGAIFATIVAMIFTQTDGNIAFRKNNPSFHGIALGYVVGYLIMDNIQKSELGTMLSTCVMGLIIMALLTASLFSKEVFSAFLNVGTGWLIGIFIGLFFSFCNHKTTNQEGGDENANN